MKMDAVTDTWPNTLKVDVIGDIAPENRFLFESLYLAVFFRNTTYLIPMPIQYLGYWKSRKLYLSHRV